MTSSVWARRLPSTSEARTADRIASVERVARKAARNAAAPVPSVRAYNNAAISIVNNTLTTIAGFNSENWNSGHKTPGGVAMHSFATNPGRIVAPVAGIYQLGAQVDWATNAAGKRWAFILVNGAFVGGDTRNPDAGGDSNVPVATQWKLAVGDYVELSVLQTSGGALNLNANTGAARSPALMATYIAPA